MWVRLRVLCSYSRSSFYTAGLIDPMYSPSAGDPESPQPHLDPIVGLLIIFSLYLCHSWVTFYMFMGT